MTKKYHKAMVRVGTNVRQARKAAGITQDELAARTGIFRTYLSRIESGQANPTLLVFVALANALDVGPGDLLK